MQKIQIANIMMALYSTKRPPVLSKIFLLVSGCQMVTLLCLVVVVISDFNRAPIRCMSSSQNKAIETFCYIHSTYTDAATSKYAAYPGVGPQFDDAQPVIMHRYFFWIPYLLTLQVFLFGLPRCCWNSFQGNLVQKLLEFQNLTEGREKQMDLSVRYFVATLHTHKNRAFHFLLCETLGLGSIAANFALTNWYLDGRFVEVIPKILLNALRVDQVDALYDEIFPKVSKCDFYKFGSSGSIEKESALCILTRNLLSGRIYTLLFVVFFSAGIIGFFSLLLRVTVFASPKLQVFYLLKKASNAKGLKTNLKRVSTSCDVGDWFLLYQLSASMMNFHMWLEQVITRLANDTTTLWPRFQEETAEN